jgi:hypothetical protein
MGIEILRRSFLWCTIINYGILLVWFFVFVGAHEWLFGLHSRWFSLSVQWFDAIHYAAMAAYKLGTLLFGFVPFLALCIISRRRSRDPMS